MQSAHSPFSFLKSLHEGICRECNMAIRQLNLDVDVCGLKIRSALETTVTYIIRHEKELYSFCPAPELLLNRINIISHVSYYKEQNPDFISIAHKLRKIGNRGAHRLADNVIPLTFDECKEALGLLYKLECIFFDRYTEEKVIHPEFVLPSEYTDKDNNVQEDDQVPDKAQIPPLISENEQLNDTESLQNYFGDLYLNDDQTGCVHKVFDFLDKDEERVFIIKGYAGTGKTTLIKGIKSYADSLGINTVLCAPTGKASKVLSNKSNTEVLTVYRNIYVCADVTDELEKRLKSSSKRLGSIKVGDLKEDELPDSTLFVIDEGSLISDYLDEDGKYDDKSTYTLKFGSGKLLTDVIEYLKLKETYCKRKLLIVGDEAQLPPVTMNFSPAMSVDYFLSEFNLKAIEYKLTKIVRQKDQSAILKLASEVHKNIDEGKFSKLKPQADNFEIFKCDEYSEGNSVIQNFIKASREKLRTAIIAYKNEDVFAYNTMVRNHYFKDPATGVAYTHVREKDVLLVTVNSMVEPYLCNGDLIKVTYADDNIETDTAKVKVGDEYFDVELRYRKIRFFTSTDHESVYESYILENSLETPLRDLPVQYQVARNIVFFRKNKELLEGKTKEEIRLMKLSDPHYSALCVKYGYAITCHKAQGSEWDCAIVDCNMNGSCRTENYFRWFYTALTRAKQKLYLKDPPNFPVFGTGLVLPPEDTTDSTTLNCDLLALMEKFKVSKGDVPRFKILKALFDNSHTLGFTITDEISKLYQEVFTLKLNSGDIVRFGVFYKGSGKLSKITELDIPSDDGKALLTKLNEILILKDLSGQNSNKQPEHKAFGPLIQKLTKDLEAAMIQIVSYELKSPYHMKVRFKKNGEFAEMNFYCNKNNMLTQNITDQVKASFSNEIREIMNNGDYS